MIQIPADARVHPSFNSNFKEELARGNLQDPQSRFHDMVRENEEFYNNVDIPSVVRRLNGIVGAMGRILVNRSELTRQGLRALMTAEHQFIFSAAGVAKSLYANQMFAYFKNASTFSIQFCPDTTPDDLFGAYDIEKFKKGEIHHNIEGSIVTHPFAFLDEFMDGNDKLLRSLLGVLLERKFNAGNQVEEAILHTAIATSNYMRLSETTEALMDRFLYKAYISPAKDMYTLLRIDHVYNSNSGAVAPPVPEECIDVREIIAVRRIIRGRHPHAKVVCPTEIRYLKNMVAAAFESEMRKYRQDYYLSPRTISKSNDCLKANALLDGRDKVNEKDVENLYYLFCTINEPLDEARTLTSQELYKRVYRSRIQYFHAIQDELRPLLLTFEFMCEAQKNREILKKPFDELLTDSSGTGWIPYIVDSLLGFVKSREELQMDNQKNSFLKLIEPSGKKNHELMEFKKKVLELIDIVYRPLEA
jgi:MoxR-like ATPase